MRLSMLALTVPQVYAPITFFFWNLIQLVFKAAAHLILQGHERGGNWKTTWFTTFSWKQLKLGNDFCFLPYIFFTRNSLVFLCCLALLFWTVQAESFALCSSRGSVLVQSWGGGWKGTFEATKKPIGRKTSGHFYVNSYEWLPTQKYKVVDLEEGHKTSRGSVPHSMKLMTTDCYQDPDFIQIF